EQARARIAVLRQGGDRAALHEAEPGAEHGVGRLGVLVEAGGQADAVLELQPHQLNGQAGVVETLLARTESGLQAADGGVVRVLGVEGVQGAGGEVLQYAHASTPRSGTPSGPSGAS